MAVDAALANLKMATEETYTTDYWREFLAAAGEVNRKFQCQHCREQNTFPVPNIDGIVKILDRAYGKPAESKTVDVIHHKGRDLAQLTEAELVALANGEAEIVEGEWTEAPPELLPAA